MPSGRCPSHNFTFTSERKSFAAFCNMSIDGGGWTVIQRSLEASHTKFDQNWETYKRGFGDVHGDYWLGNENIHTLTYTGNFELRIDFVNSYGVQHYAKYGNFSVDTEVNKYRLHVGKVTSSSRSLRLGQHLDYHNGMPFSTYDRDHDKSFRNCAKAFLAGWWYNNCYYVIGGGPNLQFPPHYNRLLYFEMKIRLLTPS